MQRFLPELKRRMAQSPLPNVPLSRLPDLPETFADFYFTPEDVSRILGREFSEPVSFYETEQLWRKRLRPVYAAPAETVAGKDIKRQEN